MTVSCGIRSAAGAGRLLRTAVFVQAAELEKDVKKNQRFGPYEDGMFHFVAQPQNYKSSSGAPSKPLIPEELQFIRISLLTPSEHQQRVTTKAGTLN